MISKGLELIVAVIVRGALKTLHFLFKLFGKAIETEINISRIRNGSDCLSTRRASSSQSLEVTEICRHVQRVALKIEVVCGDGNLVSILISAVYLAFSFYLFCKGKQNAYKAML